MIAAIPKSPHKIWHGRREREREKRFTSFAQPTSLMDNLWKFLFVQFRDDTVSNPFSTLKWAQNDLGVTF